MRATTLLVMVILCCTALLLAPADTIGQPGGKGKGGGGGMTMDANKLFEMYARGKPFIEIKDVRWGQSQMVQWAQDKGITNGQLTRPQFVEYQESLNAKIFGGGQKGGSSPDGGGGFGKKMKFGGDGGASPGGTPSTPPNSGVLNQLADEQFKRMDANGDGKLSPEEMPGSLRGNLQRWDKNGDGFIDQAEFREYFASRLGGGGGGDDGTKGIASIIIEEEELDRRTVVFRIGGKIPPGLPDWFKQLDENPDWGNKDGQVSLFEWRKGGKDLDDFRKWDMNDDGFITIEEALKIQARAKAANGSVGEASLYPEERSQFGNGGSKKKDWTGKGGPGSGGGGGKKKDWRGGGQ
ncbi:MAG: EF-hand domain-containing protein [Planctomycetes bacterium]|nr:EF-hand domain-containing protein [Planctomycetota bacterium]